MNYEKLENGSYRCKICKSVIKSKSKMINKHIPECSIKTLDKFESD